MSDKNDHITIKSPDGTSESMTGSYDSNNRTVKVDQVFGEKKVHVGPNDRVEVSSSSCFVATEVYGNADFPQVRILREYRDKIILTKGILGHKFVSFYYKIGPYLAKFLKTFPVFKPYVRSILDFISKKCKVRLK